MLAVALAGSPREGSNSEALLDAALATIADAGVEVIKHRLADLDVRPCVAHPKCRELRRCPHPDDFASLAEAAMDADLVIFAVPVYYWGVPAQFKAYIDRHIHYYGLRKYRARAIGLIIVAHNDGIQEAEDQMHSFLIKGGHAGIAWSDVQILRAYAAGPGEAANNPELVEAAHNLGKTLLNQLNS
jgi:multimeric flavodoxin WrbA